MTTKPAGVHPDATPYGDRWLLRRGSKYRREWDSTGRLIEQVDGRRETRYDIKGRIASRGEYAETPDGKHLRKHGLWEYGPPEGPVRRESTYEMGVEVERAWFQHGLRRSGKLATQTTHLHPHFIEVGRWTVTDSTGKVVDTIELGRLYSDEELFATPAMAEAALDPGTLADLVGPEPYDSASLCAWIRLAARLAEITPIEQIPCRPEKWLWVAHNFPYWHDGEPAELRGGTLGARLAAVRWGRPWHDVLEAAGLWLFEEARPHAALDFLDTAALLRGTPSPARAQVLRTLGRDDEAAEHERAGSNRQRAIPEALKDALTEAERKRGFSDNQSPYVLADVFLDHANAVHRLWPRATDLRLGYASGVITRVAACAALARYRGLHFVDTYLFRDRAARLAGSRFTTQLERLGLFGTALYDDDLLPILASRTLPRLRELELGNPREDQHYTLDGLRTIVDSIFAPRLERLGIAKRWFDADVVPDVIARLPRLHAVDLEGCDLGEGGIAVLAALPNRFTALDLDRCGVNAAAMATLAASPVLARCTTLDLGGNPLGTDGLVALARSPHLGRLEDLELGGLDANQRPNALFVEELARGVIPNSIRALRFGLGNLGPRGAHAIASRVWPHLTRLELHGNMIYDDGAIALVQSPALATIAYLDLGNNDLTDVSGIALAESPYADALEHIELGGALLEESTEHALKERFGDRLQLEYPWARR